MTEDIEYTDPQPEQTPGPEQSPQDESPPPPTWQGDKKDKHRVAKKMLVASAFLALVAVMLIFWIISREREKENLQVGKAGVVTTKETLGAREEGLNLPVAREAPAGEASPDSTVEFPLEWGEPLRWLEGIKAPKTSKNPKILQAVRDLDTQKKALDAKFKTMAAKFQKVGEDTAIGQPVTLKMDRELPYDAVFHIVGAGVNSGFSKFRLACVRDASTGEMGYFDLLLSRQVTGTNNLRFRIARRSSGEVVWQLGTGKSRRDYSDLAKVLNTLKNVGKDAPDATVFLSLDPQVSIQLLADALNAVAKSGLKDVRLL